MNKLPVLIFVLSITFNANAQFKLFDDGKVQVFESKIEVENKNCVKENWHYVKITLNVINNSTKPITINKLSANFPSDITISPSTSGGAFYPCDKPFGWTGKGDNFIAVFNQNLSSGKKFSIEMYAWVWAKLDKMAIAWDINYTERNIASNNIYKNEYFLFFSTKINRLDSMFTMVSGPILHIGQFTDSMEAEKNEFIMRIKNSVVGKEFSAYLNENKNNPPDIEVHFSAPYSTNLLKTRGECFVAIQEFIDNIKSTIAGLPGEDKCQFIKLE